MSLKAKDDLDDNDLIIILDSKSPKGSDGVLKILKGNTLKPDVTKKDLEKIKTDIEKRLEKFKQPSNIIVDNSELEKRLMDEIKALEKRFEGVKELKIDLRELDDRFTNLSIPKDLTSSVDSLSGKLSEAEKENTDLKVKLRSFHDIVKKLQAKPEVVIQKVDLSLINSALSDLQKRLVVIEAIKPIDYTPQLSALSEAITILRNDINTLKQKPEVNLSEFEIKINKALNKADAAFKKASST